MSIAKPVMRGLYAKKIKIHLLGATLTSITAGLLWKTFYMDRRKREYDAYWKYYDAEIHERIMEENGLLQSCPQ
ncbi:hypothetical protein KQX54_004120 [Cotesia glomerata]|uniref:Mitochondrial cytochrome c oxidase subunit VIc/VIIs domain-containing protein n=1 Tax=Cotesia glomerata TaxID=32391 RepID=A0AAV7I128_COTGL|nr:hypothetical protein KQX54_004120 [Cotesia glomerata]